MTPEEPSDSQIAIDAEDVGDPTAIAAKVLAAEVERLGVGGGLVDHEPADGVAGSERRTES